MRDDSTDGKSRADIIQTVQTPLGFFTLVALIVEGILSLLATRASGFDFTLLLAGMIVIFLALVTIVAFLSFKESDVLVRAGKDVATESSPAGIGIVERELPAEVVDGQLIIKSGRYGARDTWADVTLTLQSMVSGGRLQLDKRYNVLFGDPIERVRKTLIVDYLHSGREISITVPENTKLTLPLILFRSP
jgi:hypothetical protein